MKQVGCWEIAYGIESGNQELLNRITKDITLSQARKAVNLTKSVGIQVRATFMLGLPGETLEQTKQTIRFAMELDPEIASFNITTPYPNTKLYDIAKQYGQFKPNLSWEDLNQVNIDNPPYISDNLTREELTQLNKLAWRRFYLRPKKVMQHLKHITSFDDVIRLLKAGVTLTNV
jgi:radical SAM superfamily enzyme YgiQ (UPF0313 family)